jgi:hypothetical protein
MAESVERKSMKKLKKSEEEIQQLRETVTLNLAREKLEDVKAQLAKQKKDLQLIRARVEHSQFERGTNGQT